MGVSVEQWRAAIGSYNAGKSCRSLAHSSSSSSRAPVLLSDLLSLLFIVASTSLQSAMKALMLLILLSGDVERNPGPDMDHRPTMLELTNFHGKIKTFNIAERIGIKNYVVGIALLNDESGEIVPAIISEHRDNAEHINMDILGRWVQGKGIDDRTWRGLLDVLSQHCPGLAQDIKDTLTSDGVPSTRREATERADRPRLGRSNVEQLHVQALPEMPGNLATERADRPGLGRSDVEQLHVQALPEMPGNRGGCTADEQQYIKRHLARSGSLLARSDTPGYISPEMTVDILRQYQLNPQYWKAPKSS